MTASQSPPDPSPPATRLGDWPILLVICAGSLVLRTVFTYPAVFLADRINFQEPDAWYHLRLIDALVASFPHRVTIDPYVAPGAMFVPIAPFFDYLVAGIALVLGLGSPGPRLVEAVAAVVPAVLGAGIAIPVYAVARQAFGRRAGLLAAVVVSIMPGSFILRTKLGFCDHHVLEILLSTATMALLMWGVDRADSTRSRRNGVVLGRSALAGLAWGGYLLAWTSGAGLALVVGGWMIVQAILDQFHGRATTFSRVVAPAALVALLVVIGGEDHTAPRFASRCLALLGVVALAVALDVLRRVAATRVSRNACLALLGAAPLAMVAMLAVISPATAQAEWAELVRLAPDRASLTVGEARPLFIAPDGSFSLAGPWFQFGTTFIVGLAGLGWLVLRVVREGGPAAALLAVWTSAMLAATVAQTRFAYYLATNLAVLTAWLCADLLAAAHKDALTRNSTTRTRGRWADQAAGETWVGSARGLIVVAVFLPALAASVALAGVHIGMDEAWYGAMRWMRANTPDPFAGTQAYLRPHGMERTSWSVLSSWEAGYWIVREARRVPIATPTQAGADIVARYLVSASPSEAESIAAAQRVRYVVLGDDLLFIPNEAGAAGKFGQLPPAFGETTAAYYDTFLDPRGGGRPTRRTFYFATYFQSMAVRLMLHGGAATEPTRVTVISWTTADAGLGNPAKVLTDVREFPSYAEALAYRQGLSGGQHAIASSDPLATCVPIAALPGYQLVYESADGATRPTGHGSVRIFERVAGSNERPRPDAGREPGQAVISEPVAPASSPRPAGRSREPRPSASSAPR